VPVVANRIDELFMVLAETINDGGWVPLSKDFGKADRSCDGSKRNVGYSMLRSCTKLRAERGQ
jgi:hypothetical protein